jgi:hypothetical protein
MIKRFLIRNCYSIPFMIFMLVNFNLLKLCFPHAMNETIPLIIWVIVHVHAYTAYVGPAEKRLFEDEGESDGDEAE